MATYIQVEDLRGYSDIDATSDDPLLQEAIEAAQRYIENKTHRIYEATTAARYYGPEARDPWDAYRLLLDDDLLTVTTLANGDGRRDTYTATFAADTLTLSSATVYSQLETGTPAVVYSSTDDAPGGLTEGTVYYVILVASPTIQLATTRANALAGTDITLTDNGTGTQTILFGGTLISKANYWLEDRRLGPPYYAIQLARNQGVYWEWNTDHQVMVIGTWGEMATPDAEVKEAVKMLAAYLYRKKDAQLFETTAILESGAVAIPQGLPTTVVEFIEGHRKRM